MTTITVFDSVSKSRKEFEQAEPVVEQPPEPIVIDLHKIAKIVIAIGIIAAYIIS